MPILSALSVLLVVLVLIKAEVEGHCSGCEAGMCSGSCQEFCSNCYTYVKCCNYYGFKGKRGGSDTSKDGSILDVLATILRRTDRSRKPKFTKLLTIFADLQSTSRDQQGALR